MDSDHFFEVAARAAYQALVEDAALTARRGRAPATRSGPRPRCIMRRLAASMRTAESPRRTPSSRDLALRAPEARNGCAPPQAPRNSCATEALSSRIFLGTCLAIVAPHG